MATSYNEISIVWLDDPNKYQYVREALTESPYRNRFGYKKFNLGRIIGYTIQDPKTTSIVPKHYNRFQRRVWYLTKNDPYKGTDYPSEAVIPSSIRVGKDSIYGKKKS